jgi:RimJ/RimL family protein N-acetyltransferase
MARPEIRIPESLGDERVRLRPLRKDDLQPWVDAFAAEPRLGVMIGAETDPTLPDLRRRLKRWSDRADAGAGAEFVIADPAEDRLLGAVNLFGIDRHSRRGELGIWLAQAARGRGLGSASLALMLDLMFAHLGLQRAEMTATPENTVLLRVAERLGFAREGLLRSRNLVRGRRVDVVALGLLADEWRCGQPS